jgi:hypothetical protein
VSAPQQLLGWCATCGRPADHRHDPAILDLFAHWPHAIGAPIAPPTYSGLLDGDRLTSQLEAVQALMQDGTWRTLGEIRAALGRGSEAGLSARLRESRTRQAGGWTVERRRRGDPQAGLWEYRLSKS